MNIQVYSTKTCPYCVLVKQYLKSRNLDFEDVDVSQDHIRALEMIRKSGQQGVPVIDINGKIIVGFNRPEIDSALH